MGPGKWAELKEAKRLAASRKVESSNGNGTFATKQANSESKQKEIMK